MKTFSKFLTFGAMAALISACSNDNAPDGPGAQNPTTDGGYLAVNIQLPTEPSTRAENDKFDDGLSEEYAVDNAAVVLFQGSSESEAKFVGAYTLTKKLEDSGTDNKDNITVSHLMVAKVSNSITGDNGNLYALALVNYDAVATIGTDASLKLGTTTLTNNSTFKDVLWMTTDNAFYTTSGSANSKFFMTNAPLSKKIGGTGGSTDDLKLENVFTLSPFDVSKIKDTQEAAVQDPASDIYVERAVAKVTMSVNYGTGEGGSANTSFEVTDRTGLTATIEGWTVNNTEASSYIVRNLGLVASGSNLALANSYLNYASANLTPSNYRFVGHSKMGTTAFHPEANGLYRTYWCVDPHYSADLLSTEATTKDVNNVTSWATTNTIFYPHENTFSVDKQSFNNTSRVLLKVKITVNNAESDGTFFKMNDVIYAKQTDFESYVIKEIIKDQGLLASIEDAYKNGSTTRAEETTVWTYKEGDIELTYTIGADAKLTLTNITLAGQLKDKNISYQMDDIITRMNTMFSIYKYTGGYCYYDLKIKHFASNNTAADLAPWTAPETSATTTSSAYGTDETASKNYLGRYGMVRNNWYDLSVSAVKEIGSPVVPDAYVTTSDDHNEVERYIAFKIHILSWAKRTNDYILE